MGLYVYITENDMKNWRKVEDKELNSLFQEALGLDKTLMISPFKALVKKRFFKDDIYDTFYTIYHEQISPQGKSYFEAREQMSGSGSKRVVEAYLYGLINGYKTKEYEQIAKKFKNK